MRTLLKAQRLCAAALAFFACLVSGQVGADDAVTQANRSAYEWAIKCFIANGSAHGASKDAGDGVKATAFEHRARASFDTASALADKLGYSGSRFNQDIGLVEVQEMPKFVKNTAYLRDTEATCKTLGL